MLLIIHFFYLHDFVEMYIFVENLTLTLHVP